MVYVLVRVKLTVTEMWKPKFEDRGSEDFKNFTGMLARDIDNFYVSKSHDTDNKLFVNVVQIRYVSLVP